jgi:uncharacterized glyoxalase superfamily protein PhnB
MTVPFKPDGYTSVAPYLVVNGAAKTLDFLHRVFGGVELRRMDRDASSIMHAEMRIDDTVIMIADSVEGWPAVASHVHIYVPDVDLTYKLALENGAESVQEPIRKGDEDKRGGFRDAGGTTWWIGTRQE